MKKVFALVAALAISMCATLAFAGETLMMATTTSTDNTGLLDILAPRFLDDTGIELQWTAVGTGKALELGRNCDVDVLLVHAPSAELAYVEDGYGVDRHQVMYNDFVIVGPLNDPAGVAGMEDVAQALVTISQSGALFASRGDNSGTNKKEISLWKDAGVTPPDAQPWYIQTGQGMGATLEIAVQRNAYTITDRGTWIKYSDDYEGELPLQIVVEGDARLFNQYSVLAVNPERCPNARYDLATIFAEWLVAPQTQKLIGDFRLRGQQLFTPNANQ